MQRPVVPLTLLLLGCAGLVFLPFLRWAPNRLLSGDAIHLVDALRTVGGWPALGLLGAMTLLALLVLAPPLRAVRWGQVVAVAALGGLLLGLAGRYAALAQSLEQPFARTSLGAAFWVACLVLWLLAADSLQQLGVGLLTRFGGLALVAGPMVLVLVSGACDQLSILKEYANRTDVLLPAIQRHMDIVLAAMLPAVGLGVPMSWWVHRNQTVRRAVFPVLNVIQTIPSIALFGLLMAPLAWVSGAFPVLGELGVSGVGMAPGVVALMLYSLLPVVRSALAGLEQVPAGVLESARGMGLTPLQIAWQVQLPLAWPVLLGGLRTATVAAIGLASVTALIGAGGLGSIMFEGLFSSAQDLVVLGVFPIVVLAVLMDAAFKVLASLTPLPGTQAPP